MKENSSNLLSKIPKPLFGVFIVVVLIVGVFVVQKYKAGPEVPDVPAIVNGEEISLEDFEKVRLSQEHYFNIYYPKRFGENVSEEFLQGLPEAALENLIEITLLTQHLNKKAIEVTDEEILNAIEEQVVDPVWEGDWDAYRLDLKATYGINLENVKHNFRRNILIEKVIIEEDIDPKEFPEWYDSLRNSANIEIN